MKIKIMIGWTDLDKDGKPISYHEHEGNSLVIGFMNCLFSQMTKLAFSGVDVAGATRSSTNNVNNLNIFYSATDKTRGLLVGTGTTAVALTDYALETPIADGTGAGQLLRSDLTCDLSPTTSGSTRFFQMYRTFTNNSGSDITIRETALYAYYAASATYQVCLDRSATNHTIVNGTSATLTYKISITV